MIHMKVMSLGHHRGAPRIWLQGGFPAAAGFVPGVRYNIDKAARHLTLRLSDEGSYLVSRKARGEKVDPVIDINSQEVLDLFDGLSSLRVVVRDSEILITPLESELRAQDRTRRLEQRLDNHEPLEVGALAFGGGVLDHTLHEAFSAEGLPTHLAFANEIRDELLEHAADANPCVAADTKLLAVPLQELAFDERAMAHLPKVQILTSGLPCSGASVAGRAKRKLDHPECHPLVGHLVAAAIAVIARVNPACFVLENVPTYASTASASILRSQLRDLGYEVHEREFLATEFGDLEARKRWCLVAVTRGIKVDLAHVLPPAFRVRRLAEILDPPEAVAGRWSEMRGLKEKQERDLDAGKNFKMQLFDGSENSISTLTKGLAKNRSTDPKLVHPDDPSLLRVPTSAEHARAKGVDPTLVSGLSETDAHQVLGQGVCVAPFRALFRYLARQIKQARSGLTLAQPPVLTADMLFAA